MRNRTGLLTSIGFLVVTVLVFAFIYAPILTTIATSFSSGKRAVFPLPGLSFRWYGELLKDDSIIHALTTSLIVAACSMVIATVIAIFAAYVIVRYEFRGKGLFMGVLISPTIIPWLIVGISLLSFYHFLHISSGLVNVVFGHVAVSIPYATFVLAARLQGFNIHLEEAARTLGAGDLLVFRKVTLPPLLPGIIGEAFLTFLISFDEFIITFFLVGPGQVTLPIKIMSMLRFGLSPELNALATVIVVFSATVFSLGALLLTRGAARERAKA